MSAAIWYEVRLFLASLATGAGLMMVYDLLRLFRMICPHSRAGVGAEDLCYGIYCGFVTFGLLYEQNNGALRAYAIAGTVIGMAAYQNFISRIVFRYLKKGQEYIRMKLKMRKLRKKQVKK